MNTPQDQTDLPWDRYSDLFNTEHAGQIVIINCRETRFSVHKGVISRHSEYFRRCFEHPFKETTSAEFTIDHLDPQAMGVYFYLVYRLARQPEDRAEASQLVIPTSFWYDATLSQLINLHDTCNYFLDTRLGDHVWCAIQDFLRVWPICYSQLSGNITTIRSFAEAYDLCDGEEREGPRGLLSERILKVFVDGVNPEEWESEANTLSGHPKFVLEVSKGFASKLANYITRNWG